MLNQQVCVLHDGMRGIIVESGHYHVGGRAARAHSCPAAAVYEVMERGFAVNTCSVHA